MSIENILENIGRKTLEIVQKIGHFHCFIVRSLFYKDKSFKTQFFISVYQQGFQSLSLIMLSSLFIGMVLAMQGYVTLSRFGAEQALGQLIALSLIRELGPVMCALFFIGRSCSTITAELALMRVTMQIDSLEMTGVNSMARLIAPRLWAVLLVAPLLTAVFVVVALLGGSLISIDVLNVD
jgi:phospholipid/cholesterol/gamma-HCH transport system permease protein